MTAYGAGIAILLALLGGVVALAARHPGVGGGRAAWPAAKRLAAAHYVEAVMLGAGVVVLASLALGLWRVLPIGVDLLGQLREVRDDAEAARAVVIALAAALAAIGILGAIVVGAIRVWTSERQIAASERQTATIEQGHVTDRLTKAVEQLGAEKTVKRVLRDTDGVEVRDERNAPITVETTEPNLEVSLGAIYALERIARDSERDHVTVMEILCAYVRENAKARDAQPPPLADLPEREDGESFDARSIVLKERSELVSGFLSQLGPPRVDVQAALTVIGRRGDDRIGLETSSGFRLDLRETDLRRADLSGARLEGANLSEARLEGANLSEARLERAILRGARLEGADLIQARLEWANLSEARLERADLRNADIRGSNWAGASNQASPAQFADFRAGQNLMQAQLEELIGNDGTLLPDRPNEDGEPYYVWSCWETPPTDFDAIVERSARFSGDNPSILRATFLCSPDNPRRKVGTPLALDAPYPEGHPLADRD
jgi:hypothetical protein